MSGRVHSDISKKVQNTFPQRPPICNPLVVSGSSLCSPRLAFGVCDFSRACGCAAGSPRGYDRLSLKSTDATLCWILRTAPCAKCLFKPFPPLYLSRCSSF